MSAFLFTTTQPSVLKPTAESTLLKKRVLRRYGIGNRTKTEELGQLKPPSHLEESSINANTTLHFDQSTLTYLTPPNHSTPKPQEIILPGKTAKPVLKKYVPPTPFSVKPAQKAYAPPIFIHNSNSSQRRPRSISTPRVIAEFNRSKLEALNNRCNREEKFNIINNQPLPFNRR